jgi:hypothetical protein
MMYTVGAPSCTQVAESSPTLDDSVHMRVFVMI